MFILSNRLSNVPIMSIQTGTAIAHTEITIIDPRKLHVVAFFCRGPQQLDPGANLLHTSDIREVSDVGFIIDSSADIMDSDNLVRLQEIIDYKFELMNLQVYDEDGHKIGAVSDFTTDTITFLVQKLHVRRPLLKSISTTELIIDRSQIIEVTNKRIVVASTKTPLKSAVAVEANALSGFANPFRNPQTNSDSKG